MATKTEQVSLALSQKPGSSEELGQKRPSCSLELSSFRESVSQCPTAIEELLGILE